jgi:hypothetical protein
VARLFDESRVVAGHSQLADDVQPLLGVLAVCVDLISTTLNETDYGKLDNERTADFRAATTLGLRVVNSIGSATLLLEHGYFVPAAGQLRDLSETAMLLLYFSENPSEVREWRTLAGGKRHRRFGRPGLGNIIKDQERFVWLNGYFNLASEYGVHPSAQSIIAKHDGSTLCIGPVVNNDLYVNTLRDLTILTWHATDVAVDAFRKITGRHAEQLQPERVQKHRDAWETVASLIKTD